MKRKTNSNWRAIAFAAIITVVFLFAASSLAVAQIANYKVGDKIEVQYNSTWYKAVVLEAKDDSYKIRYDGYSSSWDEWVKPERMRRPGETAASKTQNTPAIKTQTGETSPRPAAKTTTVQTPVKLSPMAAKPGYIVGRAVFADGRPIPSFKVSAVGFDGLAHVSTFSTAIPSLGEVEGSNGRYALRTTYEIDRSRAVSATVVGVSAETKVEYNGKTFVIFLHPVDGKKNGTDKDAFRGDSGKGVVRDFVMKISGRKPGYEGMDDSSNAYYGAPVKLDLTTGDGRTYGSELYKTAPKGSTITVTFVPNGALLDDTAGETVTRTVRIESGIDAYFYLQDIPIGNYTATAQMTAPDGTVRELKLSTKIISKSEDFQSSARIEMTPKFSALLGGGDGGTLYLAK